MANSDGDTTRFMSDSSTLPAGTIISHTYEVEAFIARGGMGEVYRARHVELNTHHAVKFIQADLISNQRVVDLFRREGAVLRTVRHDAIVGYDGVIRDEAGRIYLVMEFVDGPSLSKFVRERGALAPDAIRLLRDRMAAGLGVAHSKGIIHRDLSPDNVILQGGDLNNAKIIDFGIAKVEDPETSTILGSDFAGKYSYASPEQLGMFGGEVGPKSDIYSLGLVLAAAAIGTPLDMGKSTIAVVEARRQVPDLSKVPEALRGEIGAMLQPDPAERPPSMDSLIGQGDRPSQIGSIPPRPELSAPPAARERRGGGRALAVVGLLVLIGAAGAVGYYLVQPPDPGPTPRLALERAVNTAVADIDCGEVAATIDDQGGVRLTGTIGSDDALNALRREVSAVDGVTEVAAAVTIQPCEPVPPDPAVIIAAVDTAIGGLDCATIERAVSADGTVTLTGTIGSPDARESLNQAIRAVAGVPAIDDQLSIERCIDPAIELSAARAAVAQMARQFECPTLTVALNAGGDGLEVSGTVATDLERDRLAGAVERAADLPVSLASVSLEDCPVIYDPRDLAGAAQAAINAVECGELTVAVTDDLAVEIAGPIGSTEDLDGLLGRLAAIDGISAVRGTPTIQPCAPEPPSVAALRRAVADAIGGVGCAPLTATVGTNRRAFVAGQVGSEEERAQLQVRLTEIAGLTGIDESIVVEPCVTGGTDADALRSAIARATEGYSCAAIETEIAADGAVAVAGFVSSDADLARLQTALDGIGGIDNLTVDAQVHPWPYCQALGLLNGLPSEVATPPGLAPNKDSLEYREGDPLIVTGTMTADYGGYLYVDYIDSAGNVVHLLPTPQRPDNSVAAGESVILGTDPAEAERGERYYVMGPPFGRNMLIAMATEEPLFPGPRPEVEDARRYFSDLETALNAVGSSGAATHLFLTLSP